VLLAGDQSDAEVLRKIIDVGKDGDVVVMPMIVVLGYG
jgi:hypothetical protein